MFLVDPACFVLCWPTIFSDFAGCCHKCWFTHFSPISVFFSCFPAYTLYTLLTSLLFAGVLVFLLLELSLHLPLVSFFPYDVHYTSFSSAALLLILWHALFSQPRRLSTSWEGTCICSSGNAVLWGEKDWLPGSARMKILLCCKQTKPLYLWNFLFPPWKLYFSNTGHCARGTWNHRIHWVHLPDVTWNSGGKSFWIFLPHRNCCHIWVKEYFGRQHKILMILKD